jgi:hypothetical protein
MDFSFRTGFRESCSVASLIQVGGRVSRSAEHADATVWDFRTNDRLFTHHRGFIVSQRVLDGLFDRGQMTVLSPSELAKEAMRLEVTEGARQRADEIVNSEKGMEYPRVSELCRVIEGETCLVVIDQDLVMALENYERVPSIRLLRHSVQLRAQGVNMKRFAKPIAMGGRSNRELYAWTGAYDPDFLGYMAGVLPVLDGLAGGIFLA